MALSTLAVTVGVATPPVTVRGLIDVQAVRSMEEPARVKRALVVSGTSRPNGYLHVDTACLRLGAAGRTPLAGSPGDGTVVASRRGAAVLFATGIEMCVGALRRRADPDAEAARYSPPRVRAKGKLQ